MMQPNIMQLMQMIRGGGNPIQLLSQMADPRAAQAIALLQGKTPQQLQQIAHNMAQERGVDLASVAQQLGLTLPK